jgi:hypothetical protein
MTPEWRDRVSSKAFAKCSPEFQELAYECAEAIAATHRDFDGSMLTMLMQKIEPEVMPRPELTAYFKNSDRIHVVCSRAAQRNYFTSAANMLCGFVGLRGPKTAPKRRGTHDKVCIYTSIFFKDSGMPVTKRARAAMVALGWLVK